MTAFASASRGERLLLVLTPAAAMAAVALGLRVGARDGVRAAIVYAAPPSTGGSGLAWQVVVFDEERGSREPAAGVPIDVTARSGEASSSWHGVTNADGVAEAQLSRTAAGPVESVRLDVQSQGAVLAQGTVAPRPTLERPAARETGWLRFARREGAVALDVALLGERAAPGFPAYLSVRATDATTHSPLGGITVALESDSSLALTASAAGMTDMRGWTRIAVTPVGLAVTATLDARSPDGRSGTWTGGLFMSPGAPQLETRPRWEPAAPIALDVTMPTVRATAYVEIDDAMGRAWATAPALDARADGTSHAAVVARPLVPGLYWAIASADAASAAALAAGTIARPFFVASSDDAALAFGTDPAACAPPRDPRDTANALSACLALSALAPAPRWTALDGFAMQRTLDREARTKGLAVALGALAIATLLEGTLLLRAAAGTRGRTVAVAVLVGLLGFALLAAFIVRV